MTKKDYHLIADILLFTGSDMGLMSEFADRFGQVDQKFDRERFLKQCGVYPKERRQPH